MNHAGVFPQAGGPGSNRWHHQTTDPDPTTLARRHFESVFSWAGLGVGLILAGREVVAVPQRRKPNELRVLDGRAERVAPVFGVDAPPPPSWLPASGKREWRRVVRACEGHPGWLQEVDRAALTAYCAAWSTFEAAAKDVAARGHLVNGDKGTVKNPSAQVMRDSGEMLRKWVVQLGFSPDARGKVDVGKAGHRTHGSDPERLLS